MARSFGAESLGADGFAVRGAVSAAPAVGCALVELGSNQLGWTASPVALNTDLSLRVAKSGDTMSGNLTTPNLIATTSVKTPLITLDNAGMNPSIGPYSNVGQAIYAASGLGRTYGDLRAYSALLDNAGIVYWSGRSYLDSPVNGQLRLLPVSGADDANQAVLLGPCTTSTDGVRIKRATGTSTVQFRNGNDSADAALTVGAITTSGNIYFGGTTAAFGAIIPSGASLRARVGDDSADASFTAKDLKLASTGFINFSGSGGSGGTTDASIARPATGYLDVRADNGLRVRNLANNADALFTAGSGTFTNGLGVSAGNVFITASNVSFQSNVMRVGNNVLLEWTNQTNWGVAGDVDTRIRRNAAGGGVDVCAANGLRVRNLANSADAPLTAGAGTFSGIVRPSVANTYDLGSGSLKWQNLYLNGSMYSGNGTAGSPSIGFTSVSDSGVWLVSSTGGSRAVAISTDGAEAVRFGGSGVSRLATFAGGASFGNSLTIAKPSQSGTRETILQASVSDAGNDAFHIFNATTVDGSFAPGFSGSRFSSNLFALGFIAQTNAANDTGTSPLMLFEARRTDSLTDPNNGSLSAITTRPLFAWQTFGSEYMRMTAGGSLLLGTTSSNGARLQVNGTIAQTNDARWTIPFTGQRDSQVGNGSGTWQTGYREAYDVAGMQCGFFGATPVAQQSLAAAATDPATTQTLANSLRTAMINLGLGI